MSSIGKPERETQNRVIALFRDELDYPLSRRLDRPTGQQQHRGGLAHRLSDKVRLQPGAD